MTQSMMVEESENGYTSGLMKGRPAYLEFLFVCKYVSALERERERESLRM